VSLLSLIPRLIKQSVTVSVAGCGCGWVEHFCCLVRTCSGLRGRWLGTLLGPEETPVWVLFSGPPPGRASNAFRFVVGVVVSGVWGVVVC
jgi:hypothetical protein